MKFKDLIEQAEKTEKLTDFLDSYNQVKSSVNAGELLEHRFRVATAALQGLIVLNAHPSHKAAAADAVDFADALILEMLK